MTYRGQMRMALLSATMMTALAPVAAHAQALTAPAQLAMAEAAPDAPAEDQSNEIIVTGTRRNSTIQDSPINITALGQETLQAQRIDDVRALAGFTPGLTVLDTGARAAATVILRGIASGDTTAGGGANVNNAVGVYLGEVPLYLDFKFLDIARVETLLGPQGTLYGLGTLSGAIRYIPNRPDTDKFSLEVHGRVYDKAHSSDVGYNGDVTVNIPIVKDHLAFRSTTGYYNDPGFIDYNNILRNPGTSLAQPGGRATAATAGTSAPLGTAAQQEANFVRKKDVNFDHTISTRNTLLVEFNPDIKTYITYAFQQTKSDGRQVNAAGALGTGKYEAPFRYLEPSNRKAHLVAAEFDVNVFDIAQLVTATEYTHQSVSTITDNSDLLLDLDYDYELFPAFSSFAPSDTKYNQFNQEVRLVSTHGGPFSWVLGGFYNRFKTDTVRNEYTPGYAAFTNNPRLDDLEYASFVKSKTVEKAIYGEGTFHITDALQVTGGLRYFKYDADVTGGTELPYTRGGRTRSPFPLIVFAPSRVRSGSTSKDGFVYKLNASYKFSPDLLIYGTYSTGYRTGSVNRVVPCPAVLAPGQNLCALPNELVFGPDKTRNAEIGVRAQLFDRKLSLNLSGFHIDWKDVQVPSQTVNGAIGITVNGAKAVSQGFEFSGTLRPFDGLTLAATYAYTDAHLTADAPGLVTTTTVGTTTKFDALDGDRLPGSTKNSGSAQATYEYKLQNDASIVGNYAVTYQGNVYSRTGLRGFGEAIPHYFLHRASLTYRTEKYELGIFGNNIFDNYAGVSVGNDFSTRNAVNDGQVLRYYTRAVVTPRVVGVEGRFRF